LPLKAFLVEDNLSIRESLAEALAELASVTMCGVASDEKAATVWLTDPSHEWDVAIVDLVLEAGGNGFGVLRACQGRPAGRQVVVLTATANPAVRRQCESLGSDGVFDKSMETDALIEWCAARSREKDGG
jgi:DNA-binding NarL/FixJ family response regulator